jgi:hypothetical protein
MAATIPFIEVAHDTHSRSARRPDNKMYSGNTVDCPEMGAHRFVRFEEGSLGEEMQLKVGEKGREGIGIMPLRNLSSMVGYLETVRAGSEWPRDNRFEQPGLMKTRHRNGLSTLVTKE